MNAGVSDERRRVFERGNFKNNILAQTYSDFEFLILDDCPEDDRELIVKSYKDRRIKYLRNETNMGISESSQQIELIWRGENTWQ
ncbi:MAG: glycosyltransferase [Alphaproteobacteria bacterium]